MLNKRWILGMCVMYEVSKFVKKKSGIVGMWTEKKAHEKMNKNKINLNRLPKDIYLPPQPHHLRALNGCCALLCSQSKREKETILRTCLFLFHLDKLLFHKSKEWKKAAQKNMAHRSFVYTHYTYTDALHRYIAHSFDFFFQLAVWLI